MESVFPHYGRNETRLKQSVIPSMLTNNESSVYYDCLGYLMEHHSNFKP